MKALSIKQPWALLFTPARSSRTALAELIYARPSLFMPHFNLTETGRSGIHSAPSRCRQSRSGLLVPSSVSPTSLIASRSTARSGFRDHLVTSSPIHARCEHLFRAKVLLDFGRFQQTFCGSAAPDFSRSFPNSSLGTSGGNGLFFPSFPSCARERPWGEAWLLSDGR